MRAPDGRRGGKRAFPPHWPGAFALGLLLGAGLTLADSRVHAARDRQVAIPLPEAAYPAEAPTRIPGRAWRAIFARTVREFGQDRIPAAAASVTFYMLLAIFPALSAFVSLYGLVGDVGQAQKDLAGLNDLLPGGAISVLGDQLARVAKADQGALGLAFAVSVAVSLWSSNAGAKALTEALNLAYETRERRGFVVVTLVSLAMTVGALVLAALAIAAAAAAPATLAWVGLGDFAGASLLRWPALLILAAAMFAVLYRFAPSRRGVALRWVAPGAALAAIGWIVMSALFSWYVANFGHYDRTYGSLGAIVGFLTWIWLSLMIVLFGAELNSEVEHQAKIEI